MTTRFLIAAAVMVGGIAAPAAAQPSVTLEGDVKVVRVVTENGKTSERLDEPTQVLPGDKLLFTTHYVNGSDKPVTDFVVTNPLPAAVRLTKPGSFEVSVDGGKTYGVLASLKVKDAAGNPRPAELGDVNAIRWKLASIAPGASGEVAYHAEIR